VIPYLENNKDCDHTILNEDKVVEYTLAKMMKLTRGQVDPDLISKLAYQNRDVYSGYNILLQC
jgi:hypothetical protein